MPFTAQELEEMRRADAEIEQSFQLTPDELAASRQRDWEAKFDNLPADKQRVAAAQRAYYEANREKVAAAQRAYREANREKVTAAQRAYREANREKVAAARRAYYEANREKVAEYQRWIRDARIAHGYTQRDLAQMLGSTPPHICQLETGRLRLEAFAKADKLREILGRSGDD